jgi:hypothetical protein
LLGIAGIHCVTVPLIYCDDQIILRRGIAGVSDASISELYENRRPIHTMPAN